MTLYLVERAFGHGDTMTVHSRNPFRGETPWGGRGGRRGQSRFLQAKNKQQEHSFGAGEPQSSTNASRPTASIKNRLTLSCKNSTHLCKVSPAGPDGPPATHARIQYSNAAGSSHGGDLSLSLSPTSPERQKARWLSSPPPPPPPRACGGVGGATSHARRRWSIIFQMLKVTSRTGWTKHGTQGGYGRWPGIAKGRGVWKVTSCVPVSWRGGRKRAGFEGCVRAGKAT